MAPAEDRSPIAIGIEWATRIMVVGAAFVLPILAGFGADRSLGSEPIGVLVGMALGFAVALLMFVRLVKDLQRSAPDRGAR